MYSTIKIKITKDSKNMEIKFSINFYDTSVRAVLIKSTYRTTSICFECFMRYRFYTSYTCRIRDAFLVKHFKKRSVEGFRRRKELVYRMGPNSAAEKEL